MTKGQLRIAIGQMNCVLGDLRANLDKVGEMSEQAAARGCELIVFPELALSGYALGPGFSSTSLHPRSPEVDELKDMSRRISMAVGFIEETEDAEFYNSAMYLDRGHIRHVHRKVYLPNYRIFDERRYFGAGQGMYAFDTPWGRMAMLVCGDMWHLAMPYLAAHDGADILLVMAASSTEGLTPAISVREAWERMNESCALTLSSFVVFSNRVGSEEPPGCGTELNFWGGSHVCAPCGSMMTQGAIGEEEIVVADLDLNQLRQQRLILPFRRDDSLSFTLDVGRKIARAKAQRRDGFHSLTSQPSSMDVTTPDQGSALEEQPPTPGRY